MGRMTALVLLLCAAGALSSVIDRDTPAPGDAEYYELYAAHEDESRGLTQRKGEATNTNTCGDIRSIPADVRAELDLNNFFQKYTETYGIPIIASSQVSDAAIKRACYTARFLLADHYSIRNGLYKRKGRFALISRHEQITDIPEYSYLGSWWNTRARGLGGTLGIPVSTGAEENALCERNDKWYNQDIVLHEYAHGMHLLGAQYEYRDFEKRLSKAYINAKNQGLWNNTYSMSTKREYFAEAVGSYLNQQAETHDGQPNGIKNHVNTRSELKQYDPDLYQLVKEMFPCNNEYIDRCNDRNQEQSLRQSLKMNYPDCTDQSGSGSTPGGGSNCGNCEDVRNDCDYYKGYCQSHKDYMSQNCKKTCKYCKC